MEMALQMPNNYVEVCDDEMMYVEGGVSFYLDENRCATITTYVKGALGLSGTILGLGALERKLTTCATRVGSIIRGLISTTLGPIGFVLSAIGTAAVVANAVSFCVGAITADRKNAGVRMYWRGVFCNFKYY
jgi:hypothetical protein